MLLSANFFCIFDQMVVCVQGLKPTVPVESPAMVFATPTKVVTEAGTTVEYLGANKVPDLQRIFQVIKYTGGNKRSLNRDT